MWIDCDYPHSTVALHMYRVGRSVSNRSRIPYICRVKIELLSRIGQFQLVWPVHKPVWPPMNRSNRSDRGACLPEGIIFSSGLQIGRSMYAFQSSRWDLRNGVVQLVIWQSLPDWFTWPVWPVCSDCPTNLNRANFGCQQAWSQSNA